MWDELIGNVGFYIALIVGFFYFVISVVVALKVIPWALERQRKGRERKLMKGLLEEWGGDCEQAIVQAMPGEVRNKRVQIKEDGVIVESNEGLSVKDIIGQVWSDIREGKREPKGSAALVTKAVNEVIYSKEEKEGMVTPVESETKYQLTDIFGRERELPTAFISKMKNTIYGKLDIFDDRELLPIIKLEGAMEHLEFARVKGAILKSQLILYVQKLAQSMEMFGIYLWKLENRSSGRRKRWYDLLNRIIHRKDKEEILEG
jgi:hypothetical protein